jgi:hypothetical protein
MLSWKVDECKPLNNGLHKLNDEIAVTTDNQITIIWIITSVATVSLSLGRAGFTV